MRSLMTMALLAALLAACTPYKMDIRQGNYITPEMRAQLKTGMTRQQVKYLLGTPMISDPFHANRWDYVYRFEHQGELVEKRALTLHFEGDTLAGIVEDGKPAASATDAPAATDTTETPETPDTPDTQNRE